MIIAVGSLNKAKVDAVRTTLKELGLFEDCAVQAYSTPSDVSDQPMSLEETIQGAKNRAHKAFEQAGIDGKLGFGLESGLMEAQGTETGYFCISICAIYNGQRYAIGTSTGFEVPPSILKYVLDENLDLTQACLKAQITSNEGLGQEEGLIGILTDHRVDRLKYTQESIHSAILQIVQSHWYTNVSSFNS